MATLTAVWSSDPEALLARAAAPFLVAGRVREPLPLLAVRQGGIRDAVLELAMDARCEGWLGTPIVVFEELAGVLAGDLAPLDAFERGAIIRRILATSQLPTLRQAARSPEVRRSLDALLGDLAAEGIAAEVLRERMTRPGRDEWEQRRDAELIALYGAYTAAIAALPSVDGIARSDGRDALTRAAHTVRQDPDAIRKRLRLPFGEPGARRSIHLYGLSDLRRGWGALLDALHTSDAVHALNVFVLRGASGGMSDELWSWLAERADRVEEAEPSARPAALAHVRSTLFSLGAAPVAPSSDVAAIAAPDMQRELEHVTRSVKRLIVDGGVVPARIAIVARQARPYANRAVEELARAGVPATARLRHTLSDVPVLQTLLRLLRCAGDGWTTAALVELTSSPYLGADLDRGILEYVASTVRPRTLAAWTQAFDAARCTATELADADADGARAIPSLARLDAARRGFDGFSAAVAPLDAERPLADWIALTLAALGAPPAGSHPPREWESGVLDLASNALALPRVAGDGRASALLIDAVRLDSEALRSAAATLTAWRAALDHLAPEDELLTRPIDASRWAQELEAALADEEVGLRSTQQQGVRVLEALAASGRTFEHVFVVGMEAGTFPADPPGSALFTDLERATLHARGVPVDSTSVWLEREASLFRSLVGSARASLTMSYSYADGNGAPQLAAAYYDEVAARFHSSTGEDALRWDTQIAGSERVPASPDALWTQDDLTLFAARTWREGSADDRSLALSALVQVAAGSGTTRTIAHLLGSARIEHERASARATATTGDRAAFAHAWNGRIGDPDLLAGLAARFGDRTWSATALERYGRCGFTFLASDVLDARAIREEEDELSAMDRGSLLHDVLAHVYTALRDTLGDDAFEITRFDAAAKIIGDAVTEVVDAHTGAWTRIEGLRAAHVEQLRTTVESYVRWEMEQSSAGKPVRRRPEHVELAFGVKDASHPAVSFTLADGRRLRLRGRIDRIDRVVDDHAQGWQYVVDHKSSASSFSGIGELRPAGAVLQLALYMAAAREIAGSELFGGVYQIIGKNARSAPLERASLVKAGLKVVGNDTQKKADAHIANAPALAQQLVDGIVAGSFPARTPGSVKCLGYCDLRTVCREERMGEWRG